MKIIFCESYLNIPLTISIAQESADSIIMTSNRQCYVFFKSIYSSEKLIFFQKITWKFPSFLFPFKKIIAFQRIKKTLSTFHNHDIYFFLVAFCEFPAWIIQYLSKKNRIHYQAATVIPSTLRKTNKIKSILHQWFYGSFFNVYCNRLMAGQLDWFPLSPRYFKKINAKNEKLEINHQTVANLMKEKLNFEGDILLLGGGILEYNFVEQDEFRDKVNALINVLNNKKIMLKLHPSYNTPRFNETSIEQIPSFIPANIVYHNFPIIIGYETSTLYESANEGKKAISLLQYYKPVNLDQRNNYIEYLNGNLKKGKTIHYPQTLDELNLLTS